jgi:hypothetical protein
MGAPSPKYRSEKRIFLLVFRLIAPENYEKIRE